MEAKSENVLDKYTFDPYENMLERGFYEKQINNFWSDKEYTFEEDAKQFKTCDDFIKRLFEGINCFFLVADGKVSHSLVNVIKKRMQEEGMCAISFLAVQLGNEMTHAVTYNTAARRILGEQRLKELLEDIEQLDCVKNKIDFISQAEDEEENNNITSKEEKDYIVIEGKKYNYYITKKVGTSVSLELTDYPSSVEEKKEKLCDAQKYVRLACGEGLFFMTQFILIGLFNNLNLFNHFCLLNNHIFKDEILHANHKCALAKETMVKCSEEEKEKCMEDIRTAYKLECDFLKYLLYGKNGNLVIPEKYNIDYNMICDAAKIRANFISEACGLNKLYEVNRDFPAWCSLIGGSVKNNFFEVKLNQSYKMASADQNVEVPKECALDDDF